MAEKYYYKSFLKQHLAQSYWCDYFTDAQLLLPIRIPLALPQITIRVASRFELQQETTRRSKPPLSADKQISAWLTAECLTTWHQESCGCTAPLLPSQAKQKTEPAAVGTYRCLKCELLNPHCTTATMILLLPDVLYCCHDNSVELLLLYHIADLWDQLDQPLQYHNTALWPLLI